MARTEREFRFDSKRFYLTYSQCGDLTWEEILAVLQSKQVVVWARFGHEQHADGGWHWHVTGEWERRVQAKRPDFVDVRGFHPNVQQTRNIKECISYVSKHGEFYDIGTVPTDGDTDTDWLAAATSMSEGDYFRAAMQARVSYMYADRFWRLGRTITSTEIGESYEADLTRECFELLVHQPHESKATVVIGPTGCGKTSWAKRVAKKPALWVRHMDMLRSFRAGYHKAIIFDDMSFAHMPREAQIHLTDSTDEAHMHVRYGVAIIPAGIQKIFTANNYPFSEDPAIARRVYKIVVEGFQV